MKRVWRLFQNKNKKKEETDDSEDIMRIPRLIEPLLNKAALDIVDTYKIRPAIEAAQRQDMGVFIISPNDKGGRLYEPSSAAWPRPVVQLAREENLPSSVVRWISRFLLIDQPAKFGRS